MNKNKEWIKEIEDHYSSLWLNKGIEVNKKNPYVLSDENYQEILFKNIREKVENLNFDFHSKTNPKSSQLLALNLFLPFEDNGNKFFQELFKNKSLKEYSISFEWIDDMNLLKQRGKPSNHDVFMDFGNYKYLIEMKFTESTKAPCSSSHKNDECENNFKNISCPLEKVYRTQYYKLLNEPDSPYNLDKLSSYYNNCPFLHGEQYQIMRYIILCYEKSKTNKQWFPVIIFPKRNRYMDDEINLTKSFLKDENYLNRIYFEDYVELLKKYNTELYLWIKDRYIF